MFSFDDPFALLAELALGLAGFGGVAAAFGGRDRGYRPTERERLVGVFLCAGFVLSGCLAVEALFSAGVDPSKSYALASGFSALVVLGFLAPLHAGAWRAARDPDSTSERWALVLSVTALGGTGGLMVLNMIWLRDAWPLVTTYSVQLLLGVWLFYRLLTRPN